MYTSEEAAALLVTELHSSSEGEVDDCPSCSSEESIAPYPDPTDDESDQTYETLAEMISKDKCFEYSHEPRANNRRISALNIFTETNRIPKSIKPRVTSPFEILKLFITSDIVTQILESTDVAMNPPMTQEDFWLWIAANYVLGISKSKSASVREMFSTEFGLPILQKCKISYFVFYYLLGI